MRAATLARTGARPAIFDFNAQLLALPAALQALNATFTRASTATVVQNGAIVSLASGQFGTTYDSVTGMYGYVAEPAATNLLTYSEQFDNVVWSPTAVAVTANATTAPDGASTADKMIPAVSLGQHRVNYTTTSAAVAHTFSVFLKAGGYNYAWLRIGATNGVYFNLTGAVAAVGTGTVSNILQIALGNGWYRCSFTVTTGVNDIVRINATDVFAGSDFAGDGTSGIYVWGAQLETGVRATSYIPTVAATATRAASVLSVPLANIPGFTAAQYTLFADWRETELLALNRFLISVSDGTVNNRAHMLTYADSVNNVCFSGGVQQFAGGQSPSVIIRRKNAFSLRQNSFLLSMGGVTATGGSSGDMPLSPTIMRIGGDSSGAGQPGFIFRAGIIARALTQAQINGLTL